MKELDKLKKIKIDDNILQDIFNLANGTYWPLTGFIKRREYQRILDEMRADNGVLWSIPIIFDIKEQVKNRIENDDEIILVDKFDQVIEKLSDIEIFPFDKKEYAEKIYLTTDISHPSVADLKNKGDYLLGGKIDLLDSIKFRFSEHYSSPEELKRVFKDKGWEKIVAFQTRNIPHKSHEFLQKHALDQVDGLLIQPVIGRKKVGDFRDELIISTYKYLIKEHYTGNKAILSILPIRMHFAGPREALHHALIRKNFGCTHMIIGRDHAGVGDFYHPLAAHDIFDRFNMDELGMEIFKLNNVAHCHKCGKLNFVDECDHGKEQMYGLSGTKVRDMVRKKEMLPNELIRPEISKIILNHNNPFVE